MSGSLEGLEGEVGVHDGVDEVVDDADPAGQGVELAEVDEDGDKDGEVVVPGNILDINQMFFCFVLQMF